MPPELVPKGAENYRPRIVYRPAFAILQVIVFGGAFIIVGLSMVLAASEVGASGVVVGSLAALFGALLAAVLISTRLVVDSEKLVFWSRFRKKGHSLVRRARVHHRRGQVVRRMVMPVGYHGFRPGQDRRGRGQQ
jgi:hypothetical protein